MAPSIKQEQEGVEEKPPAEQIVTVVPGPSNDWREPFIKYLTTTDVPADNTQRECLSRRSKHYVLVEGKLYHKNAKGELLHKCLSVEEGEKILKEIHTGTYGNHVASRTLVRNAFQASFYWPSVVVDAEALIRRCENCQFFTKQNHVLAQALQAIPTSWPFTCWGLDMIGRPFKPTLGGFY